MPGYKLYLRKLLRRSGRDGLEQGNKKLFSMINDLGSDDLSVTTARTDDCTSIAFDLDCSTFLEVQNDRTVSSIEGSSPHDVSFSTTFLSSPNTDETAILLEQEVPHKRAKVPNESPRGLDGENETDQRCY